MKFCRAHSALCLRRHDQWRTGNVLLWEGGTAHSRPPTLRRRSCSVVEAYSVYTWNIRVIFGIPEDDIGISYIDVTSSGRGLTAFPVASCLELLIFRPNAMFASTLVFFTASLQRPARQCYIRAWSHIYKVLRIWSVANSFVALHNSVTPSRLCSKLFICHAFCCNRINRCRIIKFHNIFIKLPHKMK